MLAANPRRPLFLTALAVFTLAFAMQARAAERPWREICETASGGGYSAYVIAAVALPMVEDGSRGRDISLRVVDSSLVAGLLAEGLKRVTNEERPDNMGDDSFPSGHATVAFAVAEIQSHYHPRERWLWYAGASLIAASRVELDRHFWWDVAAGAALGYGVARWELSRPRGLLLSPVIRPERGGASVALSLRF